MSLAIVYARAQLGVEAPLVMVETHISKGLPNFLMVGLPETVVRESKDRVRSALINSGFEFPLGRITVNLAPADLPKQGGRFDLPIALGILMASKQIRVDDVHGYEFAGELALSGKLRAVPGILPSALAAKQSGRALCVPSDSAQEAGLIQDISILPAHHLLEICAHLSGEEEINPYVMDHQLVTKLSIPDLSDVKGQYHARRALEIAAAGGHSMLLVGPPGTGKTMLASRLPGILPDMTDVEAIEAATIASISRKGFQAKQWKIRPYRAPHHSASGVALVGGGNPPQPGEISLAHRGVLFLDELPEFSRHVLETLREPLESGAISISRAARQSEFPANFQLVAAMNPCPCGYLGDPEHDCACTPHQIQRYRSKISGPFLDRIDLHVSVPRLPAHILSLQDAHEPETSAIVKRRVMRAVERQLARSGKQNARMSNKEAEKHSHLGAVESKLLESAMSSLQLSARVYYRILKLARTIADLADSDSIMAAHLSEALSFRGMP